jgi:hypothetical protein
MVTTRRRASLWPAASLERGAALRPKLQAWLARQG